MTVEQYLSVNPSALVDINAINAIFSQFGLYVNEVIKGAQILRYKINLPLDVKIQGKIRRAAKDIEYSLTSALKSDEVVYSKSEDYVYIEKRTESFNAIKSEPLIIHNMPRKKGLYLLLGKDIDGKPCYTDLRKAPHMIVAGTTGSGKSEVLHTFIASLIFGRAINNPSHITIIDPKRAEYSMYKNKAGIDLVTDMSLAVQKLEYYVNLMEDRYALLEQNNCKDISQLNDDSLYPYVIIIDELKDLLMQDKRAEQYIVRLAQKARACGIHLILGTQSPRADVITGLIKANVPTKIALHTTNQVESRIILDQNGAENLFGKGDMLFLSNGSFKPIRIQGAYTDEKSKLDLANKMPSSTVTTTVENNPSINNNKKKTTQKPKRIGLLKGLWLIINTPSNEDPNAALNMMLSHHNK